MITLDEMMEQIEMVEASENCCNMIGRDWRDVVSSLEADERSDDKWELYQELGLEELYEEFKSDVA